MQTVICKPYLFGLMLSFVFSTFGGYPVSFGFMERYADLNKSDASDVSIPNSSGREFPQFGEYIDIDGNVVEYSEDCFVRPYWERFADYYHKCVSRRPMRQVSDLEMKRWRNRNLRKRDMSWYGNGARLKIFLSYEKLLINIAAECYMYGISEDASSAIRAINNLYAEDKAYYWDSLRRQNPKQWALSWYNAQIEVLEEYFERKMRTLDEIHMNEFAVWLKDPKNQSEVAVLKQLAEQRKMKKTVELLKKQMNSVKTESKILQYEMQEATEKMRKQQRQLEWEREDLLRQQKQMQRQMEWDQDTILRQEQDIMRLRSRERSY